MKNVTYKEIADLLEKSEGTIKNWKNKHPMLLELVKTGAFCKLNGLDMEQIKKLVDIQTTIRGEDR